MGIKAIVFDFGGVICYPRSHETCAQLERLIGLPYESLEKIDRQFRGEWDRGTYDGAGYYRFLMSHAGIFPDDDTIARIVKTDLEGWRRINPGTVQLMRDVKAAGLTLGILSNMSHDCLAWAGGREPFSEADVAIYSCELGMIKPEVGIYEKLRERIGCKYNEIVFFDDMADNIEMAQKLRMRGFVWTRPETARAQLINLGLGLLSV